MTAPMDPFRQQAAMMGLNKAGGGFNPYAAGSKSYGITGRSQATMGPVSGAGQAGYDDRDSAQRARRQAVLQRMQAAQAGNYMSPDYLRGTQ